MKNSPSFPLLIDELKNIFKRKRIKYSQLAVELEMSESSIKRLMTGKDASLSKLEGLCEAAGISFFDLVALTKEEKPKDFELNKTQANFFAKNTHYFYFFDLLYEQRLSLKDIQEKFNLNEKSIMMYVKKLEELELCERHPGDKIIWLVQGALGIPEMNDLGRHLMKTSLKNLQELVVENRPMGGIGEGTFRMSEVYLKPESAKKIFDELFDLGQRIAQVSSREERVFGREELTLYTGVTSLLPIRLYYEDIPNI